MYVYCIARIKVSISAMTHGLSLHPPSRTLTLRYPYHEQDYCNMASNHILSRSFSDSFHFIGIQQDVYQGRPIA